jgi:hypothetical protein
MAAIAAARSAGVTLSGRLNFPTGYLGSTSNCKASAIELSFHAYLDSKVAQPVESLRKGSTL